MGIGSDYDPGPMPREPDTPLDELWSGPFGDDYARRNADAGDGRDRFWNGLLDRHPIASALEVGCNVGGNLRWLAARLGVENVAGLDLNRSALDELERRVPGVNAAQGPAQSIPFGDASFDLAFTAGVLIHVGPADLAAVTSEIVRCSRRFVLCAEYFADEETEVPYRGERGALFKRDYAAHYRGHHPELELVEQTFLSRDDGNWDDVTVWLFERRD
jgi:spore coat polysaccharide biosynthesis protein SpsF